MGRVGNLGHQHLSALEHQTRVVPPSRLDAGVLGVWGFRVSGLLDPGLGFWGF